MPALVVLLLMPRHASQAPPWPSSRRWPCRPRGIAPSPPPAHPGPACPPSLRRPGLRRCGWAAPRYPHKQHPPGRARVLSEHLFHVTGRFSILPPLPEHIVLLCQINRHASRHIMAPIMLRPTRHGKSCACAAAADRCTRVTTLFKAGQPDRSKNPAAGRVTRRITMSPGTRRLPFRYDVSGAASAMNRALISG